MNYLNRIAYDTGGYTVQEILSSFCKNIIDIFDLVYKIEEVWDEAKTIIENIRNEVVPPLVEDMIKELQDNGYFDRLVNVTLIEQLRTELTTLLNDAISDYTTKLDNFNSQLETIKNKELPKLENDILVKPFTKTKLKKSANFYGEKQIIVFGDSISWGSMVEDKVNDSWVGILRKAINLEYDNRNYGFENFYPDQYLLDGDTPMKGKHTIVDNKFNNTVSVDNIGRYKYYSQTANDFIEFTVDGDNRKMAIIYNQIVGGGKLSVEINGTIVGEIDTNGTKINSFKSAYFTLTRNTNSVKLIKKDNNLTEIIGVMYTNDNTLKTLQNFSRSGSKLFDVDNSVLDIVTSADVLIMSLGHNDSGYPDKINEFKTKIDYLIEKCNVNNTFVIVPNIIWYIIESTKPFITHLKRLAKETNGIYLDFPSLLEFSTPQEAINNGFLMDYSHPSKKGMEIIADTVINALGLGNKGKNNISDKHKDTDWIVIENTELKNGFTNAYDIDKYKFKYRRKGGMVEVVLLLNTNGAVSGTEIFQLPLGFRPFLNTEVITQVSGGNINKLLISEGGNIKYYQSG